MTESIYISATSFLNRGGWVVDSQSYFQVGNSAYLLAHGFGVPVRDAETCFQAEQGGEYHMWVRTRDWTAVWGLYDAPGRFKVIVNGVPSENVFGTQGADWHWQYGGVVDLLEGENRITLHDLTGFDGRCDAILFSKEDVEPANNSEGLINLRERDVTVEKAGHFDLLVVGGGIAGCCAAVTAARLGLSVALVHNRPVLGGNNSSEVRVGLSGLIRQEPYPKLGSLMDEIGGVGYWTRYEAEQDPTSDRSQRILRALKDNPEKEIHNAGPASNYEDSKKLDVLIDAGVTLFLNTQVDEVRTENSRIVYVSGRNLLGSVRYSFTADNYADCTGDAVLGFLANAEWRMGRESKAETGEPRAVQVADNMTMGASVQWYSEESDKVVIFPECPWAVRFNDSNCVPEKRGDWKWETGIGHNQIDEAEYIRDYALRAVFGNWSFLKNHSIHKRDFANSRLEWVSFIGGKRESRRLMGDVVLQEQDILDGKLYDDASFTTTWPVDLHFPLPFDGPEEPFLADCDNPSIKPYPVPYRCLYSRNVKNLFMAGRDISVTHIALGTVRVMRTCGMMGEVVGMAASLCKAYGVNPRGIYDYYMDDLRQLMRKGIAIKTL